MIHISIFYIHHFHIKNIILGHTRIPASSRQIHILCLSMVLTVTHSHSEDDAWCSDFLHMTIPVRSSHYATTPYHTKTVVGSVCDGLVRARSNSTSRKLAVWQGDIIIEQTVMYCGRRERRPYCYGVPDEIGTCYVLWGTLSENLFRNQWSIVTSSYLEKKPDLTDLWHGGRESILDLGE